MQLKFNGRDILMNDKELTALDELVIEFIGAMGNVDYVIVSGYIAIFFGRIRGTEDVDILLERMDEKHVEELHKRLLRSNFYPVNNVEDAKDAYELLSEGSSLRYAEKGTWAPNFELKFARKPLDRNTINNRIKITFNGKYAMYISPLELQVAFKLWLGSDKDYEDARYIYNIFKAHIDLKKLKGFIAELRVDKETVNTVLGELNEEE